MEYPDDSRERRLTQLRKGILELAVLGALRQERHYGYSLIRVLSEDGSVSLKEGTIYPILSRLDRDGLVRSEWVESAQGPPRKYYSITPAGRQAFDDLSKEFELLARLVLKKRTAGGVASDAGPRLLVRKG